MSNTKTKRQAGDRWGLICINTNTGEVGRVQIGGAECSNFPYLKQAQEEVDGYNELAKEYNHPYRYEVRYVGNTKKNPLAYWA